MNVAHGGLVILVVVTGCSAPSAPAPQGRNGGASGSGAAGTGGNGGGVGGSITVDIDSGTGAGGGGVEPDAACAEAEFAGERTPGNILFVIDRSGSMNCNSPPLQSSQACENSPQAVDANQPTKWQIVKTALQTAIAGLPMSSSAGIVYFPSDDQCGVTAAVDVPVAPLTAAHVLELTQSMDSVAPAGNTPIVGGVTLGYAYFKTASLVGNKFVVVLTDGAETCAPDQVTHFGMQTVPTALSVGIRTFVIGAPGSESGRAFLSGIAYNGGTALRSTCDHSATNPVAGDCHYDMTTAGANFAQELNQALDNIAGSTVTCEIDVPTAPENVTLDLDRVNVTLDLEPTDLPLYRDDTASCDGGADGWQYNADKTKILLCGSACNTYRTQRSSSVKLELGCAVRIK